MSHDRHSANVDWTMVGLGVVVALVVAVIVRTSDLETLVTLLWLGIGVAVVYLLYRLVLAVERLEGPPR